MKQTTFERDKWETKPILFIFGTQVSKPNNTFLPFHNIIRKKGQVVGVEYYLEGINETSQILKRKEMIL